MSFTVFVGNLVASLLQNGTYDSIKTCFRGPVSLTAALQRAAASAMEDFFEKFGAEFGTGQDSFLARQDNWDLILQSLFFLSSEFSAEALDPRGFQGAKTASREAVEYFLLRLNARIGENQSLDQHFVEKGHIQQQTEVVEGVKRLEQTLLEVRDDGRRGYQDLAQRIESIESLRPAIPALDIGREKDGAHDLIDEQIDLCRDLINEYRPSAAILVLEKLKEKKLPDRLRFRIVTNIAAAKLRMGNDNFAAAQELLQAEKLAPQDRRALVNAAIAHRLLNNIPAARIKAEEAVKLFPYDPEAYKVLLVSMAEDGKGQDPLALIPPELLSDPELCLQLGDFFHRTGNQLESRKWVRRSYELCPTNADIQEVFAIGLLEELLAESSVVVGRQLTSPQRNQMVTVRDILADLWAKARDTEVSGRYIPCVINLSNAERLLGNTQGGLALLEGALLRHPGQVQLQKQKCFCLLSQGQNAEVYGILKDMPGEVFEGKLLLEAETLAAMGNPAAGLTAVETFLSLRPAADNSLPKVIANTVRVQLVCKLMGSDQALAAALQLAEDSPSAVEYLILVSDLFSDRGEKDEAIVWAHNALASPRADGYLERTLIAETYSELGLHREAAPLYKGLITSYEEDSRNLRRLLSSYLSGHLRSEALGLVSILPEHVKGLRFYARACAELYYRIGDLPTAQRFLDNCQKKSPEDLELRLNYITLLERMGKRDDARQLLIEIPISGDAPPECLVGLAHAFARYGMQGRALSVGYEALRKFGFIADVHIGYCSLLLNTFKSVAVIDRVRAERKVEIDTAFTCVTDAGRTLTFVIVEDAAKDIAEEIVPGHAVARKTIGLRAGDAFTILESPMGKETATITEVKHKYLHALHESMNSFQYRFPDVPAMWMFSIAPSPDGGIDPKPILDAISQRSEAVMNTEAIYADHPLPLALVAHHLGIHPIDCFLGIAQGGRVPVKCCNGDADERERAQQAVLTATNGFIVDPFSLYTLHRLQLLDVLPMIAQGSIGVTQSALDLFAELIEVRRSTGPFMTISKENDQFFRTEVSGEDILVSLEPFKQILAWCAEHCEIIPAVGRPGGDEQGRSLFQGLRPVFLDTLLAASGTGRLLVSEDLHYRQIAKLVFDTEAVWSQPLLQSALHLKRLTRGQYHEAMLQLFSMNYNFVSLSAEDLIFHLAKTDFVVNNDFDKLLHALSDRRTNLLSAIQVASNFLCLLLQSSIAKSKTEKVIYSLLTHLTSNPAALQLGIVAHLFKMLAVRMAFEYDITGEDVAFLKTVFGQWCFGHFVGKA